MTILIIVLVIIAIPFIIALFVKKEYKVVREVVIHKSVTEVFDYIKHLKNQDSYSKWAMMDPNMKKTFTGTDAKVGFISAWESEDKNVGVGEQEIIKITENERIEFELRFHKPFKAVHLAYMTTEKISEDQTKVQWGFEGDMKYPMNLMLLFMNFDKMIGGDLETGLSRLKVNLES
jgi:uncharacterized protein YndB with AHSA1/START domain